MLWRTLMRIISKGAKTVINGQSYSGNNIQIKDGVVIIDGVRQSGKLTGPITVNVDGDVESIETGSGDVTAKNVGHIETGSGDIDCNDVSGGVATMSGDIDCNNVGGGVSTMSGDITHR